MDYRVGTGRMDFFESPGSQTQCVGIQIIDDSIFRCNRIFYLSLSCDDFSVRASPDPSVVLIVEDEPVGECICMFTDITS